MLNQYGIQMVEVCAVASTFKVFIYLCYSSVKYKSISLNFSTKIIKSAPKLNRSTCANKILQVQTCKPLAGLLKFCAYSTSYHMYRLLSTAKIPLHKCAQVKVRSPIFYACHILMTPCRSNISSQDPKTRNVGIQMLIICLSGREIRLQAIF